MHAAEARGHGVLGDARSCTTALVRSERALALARSGDDLPSWARYFDEAQLADEFAHCYRDLQQWRPAAQHAEKSLRLRGAAYARSRVFCRIVLAAARLGMGDLDESCALATEGCARRGRCARPGRWSTCATSTGGWPPTGAARRPARSRSRPGRRG